VARFGLISAVDSENSLRISNSFIRLLAAESTRLGADVPPVFEAEESSVRERYAPMHRLLAAEDEAFLMRQGLPILARRLRREHRRCYFGYVTRLAREIRTARGLRALAMASEESWSFWTLLAYTVLSESSLFYLRWLGCRHAVGIDVAALDVKECLGFLIAGPKFDLATT
jgi:hypothetical protein